MRSRMVSVFAVSWFMGTAALLSCNKSAEQSEQTKQAAAKYHCPMHPTVVSDKPGDCPICGMRLVPIETGGEKADTTHAHSDVPGQAPVTISPEARQTMGLKLGTVERRALVRDIHTSARIVADETRMHHVTLKVSGYVDEIFAAITGQEVKAGQALFSVYSPDLLSAQQEYITAVQTRNKLSASADADTRAGAHNLVDAARRRLELWDVSDEQIRRIERTGEVEKHVTLYAPMSGVLIERNISLGHNIQAGEVLMTIADLTHVWGDADIYQSDLPYVKEGMPLELSLPYWPDKIFRGKVIFISPTLDPQTRTLQARLEIPNPEKLLRPGMYADASLEFSIGEKLAVPAEAVMMSGDRTYTFRDGGDGRLIPTPVHIGARGSDWYEVLDGLHEGDRIVVAANFLVDSESSLKAALDAMSNDTSPTGHKH